MDQNQEALPNRQVRDRAGNDLLESGSSSNKPRWPVQVRIVGLSKTDDGDNAHWLADVDEPITVTSGVLLSFRRFRDRVLRERGVILEWMTSREWILTLDSALCIFLNGGRS
jgi:hypothetical protein